MPEDNEIRCPVSSFVDSVVRMLSAEEEESDEGDVKIDSICFDCAREQGGKWPDGHCATTYTGKCNVCGREKAVCSYNDWIWPGNKTQTSWD